MDPHKVNAESGPSSCRSAKPNRNDFEVPSFFEILVVQGCFSLCFVPLPGLTGVMAFSSLSRDAGASRIPLRGKPNDV
jgi:hypothetical protein